MTTIETPPPATPRRQARATAKRTALLDAALSEFAAHGFEGASTRVIATAAGTHQPQINYHFDSKEELWKAAVDHLFDRLDQGVREHLRDTNPGWDSRAGFAENIHAFVRAAAGLPELNRIMVQEATIDSERLHWIVERPSHVNVAELVLYPTDQVAPTIVHRES